MDGAKECQRDHTTQQTSIRDLLGRGHKRSPLSQDRRERGEGRDRELHEGRQPHGNITFCVM